MGKEAESRRATRENGWLERTPHERHAAVPLAQEKGSSCEQEDFASLITYGVRRDGTWGPRYEDGSPLGRNAGRDKAKIERGALIGSFKPPRYQYRGLRYAKYLVEWLNEPQVPSSKGAKRGHSSMALASRERVVALIDSLVQPSGDPLYSENQAVNAVIELASMHLLDRVRRCTCGCDRWLFQTRKGKREQLHYEEACRKKGLRKTSQVK